MPNTCTICRHQDREQIEDGLACGKSLRNIASQFGVGYQAVNRHQGCVTAALQASKTSRSVQLNESLLQRLARYRGIAEKFLNDDEKALSALDRCHKQLDLEAKLTGRYLKKQENEPDAALQRAILIEAMLLLHAQKSEEQVIAEVKLVYNTPDWERRELFAQILDRELRELQEVWPEAEQRARQRGLLQLEGGQ